MPIATCSNPPGCEALRSPKLWSVPSAPSRSEASSIRLSYSGPDTQDEMKAMGKGNEVSKINEQGHRKHVQVVQVVQTNNNNKAKRTALMIWSHDTIASDSLCVSSGHVIHLYLLLIV